MRSCLDEDEVLAYRSGALPAEAAGAIEAHLATCSACLEVVQILASEDHGDASRSPVGNVQSRITPKRIENYIILDELGSGGMGSVYAAYDASLDRRVALKLMHHQGQTASERIRREAQAMARLSHPNVVTVYSVHTLLENEVAISMEYVQGKSLGALMASGPQMDWMTTRSIFMQAASGLAAAHEAGLVHRDFKPDNLLVTERGQAKIIDFGLAYSDGRPTTSLPGDGGPIESLWSTPLTRTGARIGTPAYMAPEQFRQEPVDSRTDQFAFCLCLYEAVYAQRAFAADTFEGLQAKLLKGELVLPPRPNDVPRAVEGLLRRGLALDPEQRFASMRELVTELDRVAIRSPWYRSRLVWSSVVTFIVAVALTVSLLIRPQAACPPPTEAFADVWSANVQAKVRQRFLSTNLSYADDIWRRVASSLDGYVSSWAAIQVAACEATEVRHEQTPYVYALQTTCLQAQKDQFRALIQTLSVASAPVVDRAVDMVGGLTLYRCRNVSALLALPLPKRSTTADRVRQLRRRLNNLEIEYLAARYKEGLKASEAYLAEAREIGYPPVIAEAEFWHGRFLIGTQDYDASVRTLMHVYESALAINHLDLAADASREIAEIKGLYQGEKEQAYQWSSSARGLARLRDPDGLRDARSLQVLGMLEALGGQTENAKASLLGAEKLLQAHYQRAHPYLVRVASDLGVACLSAGQFDEALRHFQRTRKIFIELYGEGHKRLARTYLNLGITYAYLARQARIRQALKRGQLVGEGKPGPEVAEILDQAEQRLQHAQALLRSGANEEHKDFIAGIILATIGGVELQRGEDAEARKKFVEGISTLKPLVGDMHPFISGAYQGLGEADLAAGQTAGAIRHLEKSLEISGSGRDSLARVAMVEFSLARALLRNERRSQAQAMAESSRQHFQQQGWALDAKYVALWQKVKGLGNRQ